MTCLKSWHVHLCFRCGGGTSASKSDTCEEPKEQNVDSTTQEGCEENAPNRQDEETKPLVENGETSKAEDGDHEGEEAPNNKEKDEGVVTEKENGEDAKEEREQIEEGRKNEECEVNKNCEGNENADDGEGREEAGEGENLIKEKEEKGTEKESQGKKSKKKEGSRWICGLGKKSNKEKTEKKKKEDKKGKKSKSNEVEELEEEGIPENEKKLIDGENDGQKDTEENEEKREEEENEMEVEQGSSEKTEEITARNEEVVVFVTESEAVVEETHHGEKGDAECTVEGEGLIKGVQGQETSFQIHLKEDDLFSFTSKVQDSNGNEVVVEIQHVEGNTHKATYFPSTTGAHTIEALWKGQPVNGSPFQVAITEAMED